MDERTFEITGLNATIEADEQPYCVLHLTATGDELLHLRMPRRALRNLCREIGAFEQNNAEERSS